MSKTKPASRIKRGLTPPKKSSVDKYKTEELLNKYGTKAFTVIKPSERVTPKHIGRKVKNMFAPRGLEFLVYAYVVREPLQRDYILAEFEGASYSISLTECKLVPTKRRVRKTKKQQEKSTG